MKTLFICLVIVMATLLLGMRQQTRFAKLERKLAARSSPAASREPGRSPGDADAVRTGKSRVRPVPPTAAEVYQTVVGWLNTHGRGVNAGPSTVLDNRETFGAIMKLDLTGQRELITLLAASSDPKFTDDLYKCELINVCLSAMADSHPEAALEILDHADERIGRFYNNRMQPEGMVAYVLRRLCDHDPIVGLNSLVERVNRIQSSWRESTIAEMISSVAERDPDLALATITRFQEDLQPESWRMLAEQARTDEECGRFFKQLRENPLSNPGQLSGVLGPLFENVRKNRTSWTDFKGWLDEMNLSDEENLMIASTVVSPSEERGEEKEVAMWLLESLPESKQRNYLVWLTTIGFGDPSDPAFVSNLLQQQGINPEEMMKLNQQGYLRASQ
jgi:hypothetical protein